MKKPIRILALALAVVMAVGLMAGCSNNKPYLTVDGAAADDAVYMYYLKNYMYRVMSSYGAVESTDTFWSASLDDGVTAFDMAVELANDKVASEYLIAKKFDEYGLEWGDEEQSSFDSMYNSLSSDESNYQSFLTTQGLTDDAVKTILTNSVKQSKLHTYLISEGNELYITDERLKEYYEKTYFGAKHILFKTIDAKGNALSEDEQQTALESAQNTIAELQAGADFDTLMKARSQDEASKNETQGTLYTRTNVVAEFAQGADSLETGEISMEPVKSFYGYHIIMKLDLLEQNREDVYNALASSQFNDLVSSWISAAKIEPNKSRISKLNPVEIIPS